MARIKNYQNDDNLTGLDRLTGIKAEDNTVANYTIDAITTYLAQTGNSDGTRLGFHYSYGGEFDADALLEPGKIYVEFLTGGSEAGGFSQIKYIYFSTVSQDGNDFNPIRNIGLTGSYVKLTNVTSPGERGYGLYIVSGEEIYNDSFTKLTLTFDEASEGIAGFDEFVLSPFGLGGSGGGGAYLGDVFYAGEGEPSSSLGELGDIYFDTLNAEYYRKVSNADWGDAMSLKGDPGELNSVGATITGLPAGSTPTVDVELVNNIGRINFDFELPSGPEGPAGADGEQGPQGQQGQQGIQGNTGLQGPQGEVGPAGAAYDGNITFDSTNGVNPGDVSTLVISEDGTPVDTITIQPGTRGAKGEDGDAGPQGETGPAGPAGQDGAAGTNGTNGTDGQNGADGADGLSVDDVEYTGGEDPGEETTVTFFSGSETLGHAIIQPGRTGAQGPQGDPGADVDWAASATDTPVSGVTDVIAGANVFFTFDDKELTISSVDGGEDNVQSDWNETVITDHSYILNKPTTITDAQATAITTNTTGIATNVTNISTNTSGIATNVTNIATNTSGVATNVTNIATNTSGIATNVTNIASNDTDIATNATNIATNTSGVATNVTNIATNTSGVATNVSGISSNATNIATNTSGIATNVTNIATNTTKLAGIEAGAEVNVQADWDQATTTEDDYINNKPTTITTAQADAIVLNTAKVGITTNQADAILLNTAKVSNIQSNWTGADAENGQILNRPDDFKVAEDGTNKTGTVDTINFTGTGISVGTVVDGVVTITISGGSDSSNPPTLSLVLIGFDPNKFDDETQTITARATTMKEGAIDEHYSLTFTTDDPDAVVTTSTFTDPADGENSTTITNFSEGTVTASLTYRLTGDTSSTLIEEDQTVSISKTPPSYSPTFTYDNFTLTPNSSHIEDYDAGEITVETLLDETENNGWDVDSTGSTYSPTLGLNNEFAVASGSDNVDFHVSAGWIEDAGTQTLADAEYGNTRWTRVKSIRLGGKAETAFTATDMQDLDTYSEDIQAVRKFVSNPDGMSLPLFRDGGEYAYFAYDAIHGKLDFNATKESGFSVTGSFISDNTTDPDNDPEEITAVDGFYIYRTTSTGSALNGEVTVEVVLK